MEAARAVVGCTWESSSHAPKTLLLKYRWRSPRTVARVRLYRRHYSDASGGRWPARPTRKQQAGQASRGVATRRPRLGRHSRPHLHHRDGEDAHGPEKLFPVALVSNDY